MEYMIRNKGLSRTVFGVSLIFIAAIALLYLFSIEHWGQHPEYGYGFRSSTGINAITMVYETGRKAGLQPGDRIISINGKRCESVRELRETANKLPGQINEYVIERGGRPVPGVHR